MSDARIVDHGIEWGPLRVVVACSVPAKQGGTYRILELETPRNRVQVTVTPTGYLRVSEVWKNERPRAAVGIEKEAGDE